MANLNGIRFRYFNGITVGDINDFKKWIESLPSVLDTYVKNIVKDGNTYTATIVEGEETKTLSWTIGGGGELTPEALMEVLEGSETVVVDINEEGDKVQVRLDADVVAKLSRALVTPIAPPSAVELVGIGTNGAQQQIHVGQGLEVVNSTLRATAGSLKYLHRITITGLPAKDTLTTNSKITITIVNDDVSSYTDWTSVANHIRHITGGVIKDDIAHVYGVYDLTDVTETEMSFLVGDEIVTYSYSELDEATFADSKHYF